VLGVRVADRFGKGVRTAPRDALVADSIDEKQRGLAFGMHRAGDTAGAFLGVLIAALIVWLDRARAADLTRHTFQVLVPGQYPTSDTRGTGACLSGPGRPAVRSQSKLPVLSLKGMDARFKLFMLVLVLFTLGNSSDAFIILLGQNRGPGRSADPAHAGHLQPDLFRPVRAARGALDKIGRRRLIIGGWIAYGLVYLGFALSKTGWQIWDLLRPVWDLLRRHGGLLQRLHR